MAFINKDDYRFSISLAVLDTLTGGDDAIINELSAQAIEEAKSYLNIRFDTDALFALNGDDRHKAVMMYCKDLALYHLYSINTLSSIPETRVNRYTNALNFLKDVRDQKINLDKMPLNYSEARATVKSGTNEKRINHQL